jgi:hypothetical protein
MRLAAEISSTTGRGIVLKALDSATLKFSKSEILSDSDSLYLYPTLYSPRFKR